MKELLLRVVGRVREYSGVNASCDSIYTAYNDAMSVCLDKVLVQKEGPHSVHELAFAVCENIC